MSTFQPPPPYTPGQLAALYPDTLELCQVQVIFRHGERTPVSPRLQNAGVPPFWPYCSAASLFKAAVLNANRTWDTLAFQRRLETYGENGEAVLAAGPGNEVDRICLLGELTDRGRETTLALGSRLRKLYVDQLGFLPPQLAPPNQYLLRATPISRVLESLQQVFTGLYPVGSRADRELPEIRTRSPQEENLFTNEANCRRLSLLTRAFAAAAVKKWNTSPEMAYLQSKIGKWMPEGEKVAVDGHPRLSGLMDTLNATLAHGAEVRLPEEFYDEKVMKYMNDINIDEWYLGFTQSSEFRRLAVGPLLGDVRDRALAVVRGKNEIKLVLLGCHDTTIVGVLSSLGVFNRSWPPFTSSIAIETFRVRDHRKSFWKQITGGGSGEKGWYVRMKYNEEPVVISGCRKEGKHLKGDESFCTMEAFREILEKLVPQDWKRECLMNTDKPGIPEVEEVE